MKETPVSQRVQLEAAQIDVLLMRNNVGACQDATGRVIRYGLMNESAKVNERVKSSDLIGITPVVIHAGYIGMTLGVFTAVETKRSDWQFVHSDERAVAQMAFHDIVRRHGGFAGFARSPEEFKGIIKR